MPVLPPAVHRTIVTVDVEGFGNRHRINPYQVAVREGLYRVLRQAFRAATIPWIDCHREHRGDGILILAPPEVAKSVFVESLPAQLVEGLCEHNSIHPASEQIRLRMALHAGELHYDDHGVTGTSVNLTFRLLDAGPLKSALAESPGVLALITSSWFFEEVVRHSPTAYRPVRVRVKETNTVGLCPPLAAESADFAWFDWLRQRPVDLLAAGRVHVGLDHTTTVGSRRGRDPSRVPARRDPPADLQPGSSITPGKVNGQPR